MVAVKVIVLGNDAHFVLVKNEKEISVPPPLPPDVVGNLLA